MSDEHRVATHLGIDAAVYDAQIRRYIPGYEEMLAAIVAVLDDTLPETPTVVDLGAGTGALAAAILDGIPRVRVELVDIDPTMLEVARRRLEPHGPRASFRRAAFADPLPACDAVVASLALHHIADPQDKRAMYASSHGALRPGGVLLSGDATVHPAGAEHDRVYRQWRAGMAEHGIDAAEANTLFAQWAKEDVYQPLATELALLADAGFARPDCFWKRGAMTVFGAFKR